MSQAKVTKRTEFLDNLMMREPQHDLERHIFEPNKLEIPCVIVDMQVAQSLARCVGHMIGNGCWNINALPARQLRPEIKIGVLVVKKKILVQEADLLKHSPSIQHRGPTGPEDRLGGVKLCSILSQSTIKPNSRRRKAIASTVKNPGILENEL